MRSAYLEYAVSVIVGRAFPHASDGLKPVQRRILYTMWEEGIRSNTQYKKSARAVGTVLAKYHPHGELAVYDALVRMAQPFSLRYPLVDGQGNFGSVDNDPPAAMRYTEARLTPIAEEMMADIEKETVDVRGQLRRPGEGAARPARQAAQPPAQRGRGDRRGDGHQDPAPQPERAGRRDHLPDRQPGRRRWTTCCACIPGPDFPTAGLIMGTAGIRSAYATGRGRVVMRARAEIEEAERESDRRRIVVTELPYQVNKATLQEKIADLVGEKRLDGIANMRDESDRQGMRLVIELKRDARPQAVLNQLFKHTALQTAFNVNMVAVAGQQPAVLTLKTALQQYIDYRQQVVSGGRATTCAGRGSGPTSWRACRSPWTTWTR